jgi:hypothetical protein
MIDQELARLRTHHRNIQRYRNLLPQFATNAPPGMYFEPAASFSETAIEPQSPQKEARRVEVAGLRPLPTV